MDVVFLPSFPPSSLEALMKVLPPTTDLFCLCLSWGKKELCCCFHENDCPTHGRRRGKGENIHEKEEENEPLWLKITCWKLSADCCLCDLLIFVNVLFTRLCEIVLREHISKTFCTKWKTVWQDTYEVYTTIILYVHCAVNVGNDMT